MHGIVLVLGAGLFFCGSPNESAASEVRKLTVTEAGPTDATLRPFVIEATHSFEQSNRDVVYVDRRTLDDVTTLLLPSSRPQQTENKACRFEIAQYIDSRITNSNCIDNETLQLAMQLVSKFFILHQVDIPEWISAITNGNI